MASNPHEFLLRLKALFSKRRLDRDMADELDFHQSMLRDKMRRQGVPESEVDLTARRRFGNSRRWHERLRELWQFRTLENLSRDLKLSVRLLWNSPGFTAVALLTLALGVGANATVFSMINGLLLRPLTVPESDRLAVMGMNTGGPRISYSHPEPFFRAFERQHKVFEQLFAFDSSDFQVKSGSGNEIVSGQFVSGSFFSALRIPPVTGRVIGVQDDVTGGNPAGFGVVISEQFWDTWFSHAPDVIGRKLEIDNTLFTVVGVMPKAFIGADPMQRPQIFLPLSTEKILNGERSMIAASYHGWWLTVMGRLQPGVTVEQADAQVSAATQAVLAETVPNAEWIAERNKKHFHFTAEPGSAGFTYLRGEFSRPLMAVFAMCGGILLLACLNLASLLMARGTARQRELATRLAMGATRRRLIQQLMVENLLLGVCGTALGVAAAPLVSRSLAAVLLSGQRNAHIDTSLDIRVFAFAIVASIAATLLFGLVPALQATSRNLIDRIKDGQHATQTRERRRILPRVLLATEVGLALMLVVGAGLIASSLIRLYRSGEGFDPRGVQNIRFSMDKQPLTGDALINFYHDLGDQLGHQPGVKNQSFALMVPLTHWVWDQDFSTTATADVDICLNNIAPGYFAAMGIPMYEGRDYLWTDTASSGSKIILNQTAARQLFPSGHAVGSTVIKKDGDKKISYLVIGVVGDVKYEDLRSVAPPGAYMGMMQDTGAQFSSYYAVVRADGPTGPLASAARSIVTRMLPTIPAPLMSSLSSVVDDSLSSERMMTMLSVFFALCALIVTAIGLYGTLAYATARRTSEIGIRMALGAQRAQVIRMVFGQNLAVVAVGTAAGVAAALLASRALASFLYGTSTRDPLVVAGAIFALAFISSAASLLPALRAACIQPMSAIRCE